MNESRGCVRLVLRLFLTERGISIPAPHRPVQFVCWRLDRGGLPRKATGEPGGHYFLAPDFNKDLVQSLNGTIVENDTAYPGRRFDTASHKQVLIDHGFAAIAPVDVLDEDGSISLPFSSGTRFKDDFVGSHFANYDSFLILSYFKGPAINGFGGAFKNMSTKWGSSAGARMAGNIALSRSVSFGQDDLPKPSVVIMAYTGQSSYSWLRPGAGHLNYGACHCSQGSPC